MEQNLEIVKVFNHTEFGNVRVIGDVENPRFCLADVCKVLGLDASQVMKRLNDGVVSIHPTPDALGRTRDTNFVNEDGLYDVILDSRKPAAKKFRKWLTSEVIPSIRKTGLYINPNAPIDPNFLRRMADELEAKDKKIAEQEQAIALLKPKADYTDNVLKSDEKLTSELIAKEYGHNAQWLHQILKTAGKIYNRGRHWFLKAPFDKCGYRVSETTTLAHGKTVVNHYWTQSGRHFVYNVLAAVGYYPLGEEPLKALL